jgi:uncharacterized protein (TIGR01777 family)
VKIVIAGGSGYLGGQLADWLTAGGWQVTVLSRRTNRDSGGIRYAVWDGDTVGEWAREIDGADALINLAGRSVNCRYNEANRREIYDSRLKSTRALGEAIAGAKRPPLVWLNASSATIFRHAEDRPMDEATGEIGHGFSVDVCQRWEAEFEHADTPHTRKVALRSAMVFGPGRGGVFEAFHTLARRGLGGTLGTGRQYVSWIHVRDFCRAVDWLRKHDLSGPVNLASPNPLPNREFMRILREEVGVRFGLPSTRWMLEFGALMLGTETELLLKSRRVIPGRLLESGFTFDFPEWRGAVRDIRALERAGFGKAEE